MALTVKIDQAKRMAFKTLLVGLVPMLWGPPAIGKSAIVHQIAVENNLFLIDERLSDCDPTDLKGYPFTDKVRGKGGYLPMEQYPIAGDVLPAYLDADGKEVIIDDPDNPGQKMVKRYSGWLLFLDELTNADDDVKKAAYKLILDRMVGQKKLHPNCVVVAAGNDASHGALAGELGTALQSRVVHIEIDLDFKTWMAWAIDNGISHMIRDYLNFTRGEKLYTFRPDHTDKTFASPRTWEFASKMLAGNTLKDPDTYPLLAGSISPGVAAEFMQFTTVYASLPTIETVLQGPDWAPVPTELSSIFAMCGNVATAMTTANASTLMKYIKRMGEQGPEYVIITLIDAIKRDSTLTQHPEIRKWAMANGSELF